MIVNNDVSPELVFVRNTTPDIIIEVPGQSFASGDKVNLVFQQTFATVLTLETGDLTISGDQISVTLTAEQTKQLVPGPFEAQLVFLFADGTQDASAWMHGVCLRNGLEGTPT